MKRCECGEEVTERGPYYHCDNCGSMYRGVIILEKINGPVSMFQEFLRKERRNGTDLQRFPGVRPPVFYNDETQEKWEEAYREIG